MKFEYYKDDNSEWRWRLRHTNGNILGDSSEGYKNKDDMTSILHNTITAIQAGGFVINEVAN